MINFPFHNARKFVEIWSRVLKRENTFNAMLCFNLQIQYLTLSQDFSSFPANTFAINDTVYETDANTVFQSQNLE